MGCVLSTRYRLDSNPCIFEVTNVDDNGQERYPGHIEITDTDLILHQTATGKEPIRWPLNSLRRYGFDAELFSFESGRRCPTGPAIYAFRCRRPEPLFNLLQECIIRAGQAERVSNHSEPGGGVGGGGVLPTDHNRSQINGGPDHNRLRLLGGGPTSELHDHRRVISSSVSDRQTRGANPNGVSVRPARSPQLLLANWAGPEAHRTRLCNVSSAPVPNSLASLCRRTADSSSPTSSQPSYVNTYNDRSSCSPHAQNGYMNDVPPFIATGARSGGGAGGGGIKWTSSVLSSHDDLLECLERSERVQSDVQYADLDLVRRDSPAPGEEEEEEEDVEGDAEDGYTSNVFLRNIDSNSPDIVAATDPSLVYINVVVPKSEQSLGGADLVSNDEKSLSKLPVISELSEEGSGAVVEGGARNECTAEYANIASPRRAKLSGELGPIPPITNSSVPSRRSTVTSPKAPAVKPTLMAVTAKLQPLSPPSPAASFAPVARLQPPTSPPSATSKLKPPQTPATAGSAAATSPISTLTTRANQRITYVQLDLQPSPSAGSVGGKVHPLGLAACSAGFVGGSSLSGTESPQLSYKPIMSVSAVDSGESYATIDFQRTLALNSKCVDEGIRKTRHNSHIEMVSFN